MQFFLILAVLTFVSADESHLPLFREQNDEAPYQGDHAVEEPLPSFSNFLPTEETWCRGGRGRIIGGYQSEPGACALLCEDEPSCGGFNLRAVDGICAAYTHGCREDTNVEWTFYRRKPKASTDEMTSEIVDQIAPTETMPVDYETSTEPETTTITTELTPSTTEEPTTTTSTSTSTEPTTTTTEATTTEEETTKAMTEPTTTERASFKVEETTYRHEETTTEPEDPHRNVGDLLVASVTFAKKAPPSGKFVDSDNDLAKPSDEASSATGKTGLAETIVPAVKDAVFGEYQPLKGNCRGGSVLKMFVEVTPKQCADACSAHCSCVGFTYADDSLHCVLKESRCELPFPYHPNVNYFAHIYRHPSGTPSNKKWGY